MKEKVKCCTTEWTSNGYHFICYPDPDHTYIDIEVDRKRHYDCEEEIEINDPELLPYIKAHCRNCYFIRNATYGFKHYKNTESCDEDDYYSHFEPRKELERGNQVEYRLCSKGGDSTIVKIRYGKSEKEELENEK